MKNVTPLYDTDRAEYVRLAQEFIDLYVYNMKLNKGVISTSVSQAKVDIFNNTQIFDTTTGVCKLKFGVFNGVLRLHGIDCVKSLKNLPQDVHCLILQNLHNLKTFDLPLIKNDKLFITGCPIYDLSEVHIPGSLYIDGCINLDTLDKLPRNIQDSESLHIKNMYLHTHMKTSNNNILWLDVNNVEGITNFENLPSNIQRLSLDFAHDFVSWRGINNYSNLYTLTVEHITAYNNIINVLLCNKLEARYFFMGISLNRTIEFIIEKYMNIEFALMRSNYIMDCVVELIDSGFEDAAEL